MTSARDAQNSRARFLILVGWARPTGPAEGPMGRAHPTRINRLMRRFTLRLTLGVPGPFDDDAEPQVVGRPVLFELLADGVVTLDSPRTGRPEQVGERLER